MTVLHWERDATSDMMFGIMPSLCGRERVRDWRMLPPNDAHHQKACRAFFAERRSGVTCKTCKRMLSNRSDTNRLR